MERYVGYKGKGITWVSTNKPTEDVECIKTSVDISDEELIRDYEIVDGELVYKYAIKDPKTLKVAMISSYGINCGIATYAKYLGDEIRPLVKDLKFFAEIDPLLNEEEDVIRCWNRKTGDYSGIFSEIDSYSPDVIYIQHEYGAFNNGAAWNSLVSNLSARYRTIVVLHSVYDHFSKLIYEAPCTEIITHSKGGRELLKERGITHANIHYIPHGCLKPIQSDIKHSSIGSNYVMFQYGFGFEYKGWENAIEVVDKLKDRFPELVYIGVFNVSKFSEDFNNSYYERLINMIKKKNLEKHVALHKGFRSNDILLSYMAQAKINIFPYWNHPDWLVHGASGAVRLALASGTPTILGDVPFFSEFKGYLPVCSSIDDYVETVSNIFEDKMYRDSIKKKTNDFISERTWEQVAQWYLSLDPKKQFTAL